MVAKFTQMWKAKSSEAALAGATNGAKSLRVPVAAPDGVQADKKKPMGSTKKRLTKFLDGQKGRNSKKLLSAEIDNCKAVISKLAAEKDALASGLARKTRAAEERIARLVREREDLQAKLKALSDAKDSGLDRMSGWKNSLRAGIDQFPSVISELDRRSQDHRIAQLSRENEELQNKVEAMAFEKEDALAAVKSMNSRLVELSDNGNGDDPTVTTVDSSEYSQSAHGQVNESHTAGIVRTLFKEVEHGKQEVSRLASERDALKLVVSEYKRQKVAAVKKMDKASVESRQKSHEMSRLQSKIEGMRARSAADDEQIEVLESQVFQLEAFKTGLEYKVMDQGRQIEKLSREKRSIAQELEEAQVRERESWTDRTAYAEPREETEGSPRQKRESSSEHPQAARRFSPFKDGKQSPLYSNNSIPPTCNGDYGPTKKRRQASRGRESRRQGCSTPSTTTHHRILQVDATASLSEIKSSYRKMVLKYHPDKNKGDTASATEKFIEISKAYKVLRDTYLGRSCEEEVSFEAPR